MYNEEARRFAARPATSGDQRSGSGTFPDILTRMSETGWRHSKSGLNADVSPTMSRPALALHLGDAVATWLRIQHADVRYRSDDYSTSE